MVDPAKTMSSLSFSDEDGDDAPPPTATAAPAAPAAAAAAEPRPLARTATESVPVSTKLPDFFKTVGVYVHGQIRHGDQLERYVRAFGGSLVYLLGSADSAVTHVVTDRPWDADLDRIQEASGGAVVVRPAWVWDSVNANERVDEASYVVESGK